MVDPKILYRKVLEFGDIVSAIVLLHNHPSGNMRPSPEDDRLTRQLKDGGALLDIRTRRAIRCRLKVIHVPPMTSPTIYVLSSGVLRPVFLGWLSAIFR